MRLDVSGPTPWLGVKGDWSGFRITLEGIRRPSRWAARDGTIGLDGAEYIFAFSREKTRAGRRLRRVPHELVLRRVVIERLETSARLILDVPRDRVTLDLNGERRKTAITPLLDALPLVERLPGTGRRVGSIQAEDVEAWQRVIESAATRLRRNYSRVTVRSLATELGYDESTLGKKVRRLKLSIPR